MEKWKNSWWRSVVGKRVRNREEGARGSVAVKALRYKPAGRGFDSR